MNIDPTIGTIIASVLSAGGASWFGVKRTLNGTKERVERIEDKLDRALEIQNDHTVEIAILNERVPERRKT